MTRRALMRTVGIALLAAATYAHTASADQQPLPMRERGESLVYETPFKNMVILEFILYDNKTWCRLYVRKEAWEAAKQNGGYLPEELDPGQLQCEQR